MSVAREESRLALALLVELMRIAGGEDDDELLTPTAHAPASKTERLPVAGPVARPRRSVVV